MPKYRVVTFDGGGVRGALTTALLKRITVYYPELFGRVRLFAGTSTGSFIALGLAHGLKAGKLAEIYSEENAGFIFSPRYLELFRPKYNNSRLRGVLEKTFPPDLRLRDLKHFVLIPSFNVSGGDKGRWGPVFYNNFPGSPTRNERVVDVALASSAAPAYFPSHKNNIDGGVVANNPSTAAIALARDKMGGGQNLDDVCLLSVGTGYNPLSITADTTGWGAMDWIMYPNPPIPILSLMFDGVAEADVHYSSQLLGDRYYRLNVRLPEPVALDQYDKIPELTALAGNFDLTPVMGWIKKNFL